MNMDIIPDDAPLEGKVLEQAIIELTAAGFEMKELNTPREIVNLLNSLSFPTIPPAEDILTYVTHPGIVEIEKRGNDAPLHFTYGYFKEALEAELRETKAYEKITDRSRWTAADYELDRQVRAMFDKIFSENDDTPEEDTTSSTNSNDDNIIHVDFGK